VCKYMQMYDRPIHGRAATTFLGDPTRSAMVDPELSMVWVDPWVELGWVGSTVAKVLKI